VPVAILHLTDFLNTVDEPMADLGFVENVALVLITAGVSGLGVPLVLKHIDEARTQELKNREAALSRQSKIIDAQAAFLDELSQVLWEWRYTAMKITYYGSSGKQELYEQSCEKYQNEIWQHLNKIRNYSALRNKSDF
jgi:hypothetical protein